MFVVVLCLTKPAFMRHPWRITPCPAVHGRTFLCFMDIISTVSKRLRYSRTWKCACLSGALDLRVYSMAKIKNINSLFHIEEKSDNILRYEKIAAGHTNMWSTAINGKAQEYMMSNTNDLLNRINAKYSTMSKGHKLLAHRTVFSIYPVK